MESHEMFKTNLTKKDLEYLLGKWIAIIDGFRGDNGKGKIANCLAYFLKIVMGMDVGLCVHPNGGNNAGHEVYSPWGRFGNIGPYKGHLVSMGILQGIPSLVGPGAVFDPKHFFETELQNLADAGVDIEKVFISYRTNIVLPHYATLEMLEALYRGKKALGTTKKAIGPSYEYRAKRAGIKVEDLFINKKDLKEKINYNCRLLNLMIKGNNLSSTIQFDDAVYLESIDPNTIYDYLMSYKDRIKKIAVDEIELYQKLREKKQIGIIEPGQGTGLDNIQGDSGEYRGDTTSSLTTVPGIIAQAGLTHKDIAYTILIVKGPYWTSVGNCALPTKMSQQEADIFRGKKDDVASEYGTTTGRPRDCVYPDLKFLKRALLLNAPDCICLTKMDKTANQETLKIRNTEGQIENWDAWDEEEIKGVQTWDKLPYNAQMFIDCLSIETAKKMHLVKLLSTGPSLEDIAMLNDFLKKPKI